MAIFDKIPLSGGANYALIPVTGTTSGTSVDVHDADATAKDEVWIYANNIDTVARLLTLEWGGVADAAYEITMVIPAQSGPVKVIEGIPLTNSLAVKAFAAVVDVINISGFVNRIG